MRDGIVEVGHPLFEKAVKKFEKAIIKEVKRIVVESAEMAVRSMKYRAPVDDGNLRKSIEVTYMKGGLTAIIRVGAEYAIYVEYGTGIYAMGGKGRKDPWVYWSDKLNRYVYTRGIMAQPFFNPGIEKAAKYFTKEMNKLGA